MRCSTDDLSCRGACKGPAFLPPPPPPPPPLPLPALQATFCLRSTRTSNHRRAKAWAHARVRVPWSRQAQEAPAPSGYLTLIPLSDARLQPRDTRLTAAWLLLFALFVAGAVFVTVSGVPSCWAHGLLSGCRWEVCERQLLKQERLADSLALPLAAAAAAVAAS